MSDWLKCSERLPPEGKKYDSLCLLEYGQMQSLNGCTTNGFAMSKRKLCNRRVQIEQSMLALVNAHHAAVINIDPSGLSKPVADALCDVARHWTIYIAGIYVRQDGSQYIKSIDIRPDGVHMAEGSRMSLSTSTKR
ncbi:hypothetical protein FBY06_121101 [Pseudomonas sp. SJZ085]|uniref:hypothetical protein n=1 Tax=unclassified Pseudomonas TaxID=196821 RepID=UPI00119C1310|nr:MULTISPECIES: hypothetical protein [unclassified Pseudomonas]TWC16004.1 hypothetical protein FBX99_1212 [Pseudomonas sp. SJZ074]TWC34452.1 hypothetical protein FBY06_121101 [Pseudomonas sp. SJZ085]